MIERGERTGRPVQLHPNPTSGWVSIGVGANAPWRIHAADGRLMLEGEGPRADFAALPVGLYLLRSAAGIRRVVRN